MMSFPNAKTLVQLVVLVALRARREIEMFAVAQHSLVICHVVQDLHAVLAKCIAVIALHEPSSTIT